MFGFIFIGNLSIAIIVLEIIKFSPDFKRYESLFRKKAFPFRM